MKKKRYKSEQRISHCPFDQQEKWKPNKTNNKGGRKPSANATSKTKEVGEEKNALLAEERERHI